VAALDHPNIVSLLDYNLTDDGVPYVVLEFLDGEHLGARIGAPKLSLGEMMRILVPVAQGLEFAHQRDIIHRDLKPENIIIARHGEQVKVVDFGSPRSGAASSSPRTTPSSAPCPTWRPSSSSAARSTRAAISSRSASLVYEMLTGEMAFGGRQRAGGGRRGWPTTIPAIAGLSSAVNGALGRGARQAGRRPFPSVEAFARRWWRRRRSARAGGG